MWVVLCLERHIMSVRKASRRTRDWQADRQAAAGAMRAASVVGRRGRIGVWVPRVVRDSGVSATAIAVAVVLYAAAGRSLHARLTLSQIMTRLGRPGRRVDAARRALQQLVDAGLVTVRWGSGTTLRIFLVHRPRPKVVAYDVVPHALVRELAAGTVPVTAVRVWLVIDQALGARGWTSDTAADFAERLKCCARTVARQVASLISTDLIARDGAALRAGSAAGTPEDQPRDDPATEPNEDAAETKMRPFKRKELTPESYPGSSTRSVDRSVSSPHEPTSGLGPKKKPPRKWSGRYNSADVQVVLAALPRSVICGQARWLPGVLSTTVSALTRGCSAAALAEAVRAYLDLDATGGRLLPAFRVAVRIMQQDIRLKLACQHCGRQIASCRCGASPGRASVRARGGVSAERPANSSANTTWPTVGCVVCGGVDNARVWTQVRDDGVWVELPLPVKACPDCVEAVMACPSTI